MKYRVFNIEDSSVIISNHEDIIVANSYPKDILIDGYYFKIVLTPENDDEKKSKRIRASYFSILESVTRNSLKEQKEKIDKYSHIIKTISIKLSQKIDEYFDKEKWYTNNYLDALQNIELYQTGKLAETNKLIHYFNKMSVDLKNHIDGWDIIYTSDNFVPAFKNTSLKKALLRQLASFQEEFNDININFKFSDHFLEDYQVSIDKKLFSLIMYNFFANAAKYSKPYEEIRVNYSDLEKTLDISMYSARIERSEIENIFCDGIRGIHANKVSSSGNGSGMFVIKKSLELMSLQNMYIDPDYAKSKEYDGTKYYENHFKFKFCN